MLESSRVQTDILCSIVIPVYNGEEYIKETLKSCFSQTIISAIEIVVVDDFSSDTSLEILQEFAGKYHNFHLLRNKENLGITKSLNRAVRRVKGRYILFLGHDDMLPPQHVELLISEFEADDFSFVHCNSSLVDGDGNVVGVAVKDRKQNFRNRFIRYFLTLDNVVHSTGAMIDRKYFELSGGWDEQFKNYGEWLLWIKLVALKKPKYSIKSKAFYRRHESNITNTFSNSSVMPELFRYSVFCQSVASANLNNVFLRALFSFSGFVRLLIKFKKMI